MTALASLAIRRVKTILDFTSVLVGRATDSLQTPSVKILMSVCTMLVGPILYVRIHQAHTTAHVKMDLSRRTVGRTVQVCKLFGFLFH